MVITRRIEVYVSEEDKALKKDYIHTIYTWRDKMMLAANMVTSHKFVQQNIRDFAYIKDEMLDKFYVKDILKEGRGMSEENVTYRVLSSMLKGIVSGDMMTTLNRSVCKAFKENIFDVQRGKRSLQSYKSNMPMPFSKVAFQNIHKADDGRFYFTLFGVPFCCRLGADRSNNQSILEKGISGEYQFAASSLVIDDKKKKIFFLLCVNIPQKEVKLTEGKKLYAFLGVQNPIQYAVDVKAKQEYDSGLRMFSIGTEEEFNYRRRQIQEAVKRCQINNRYSAGGHGRKKKCQAIDRWHDKENNYVDTKLHTYSKMLIDAAVKHQCSEIVLMNQTHREDEAKVQNANGDNYVLRNWGYFGLKEKIAYKAKMYGIKITEEK